MNYIKKCPECKNCDGVTVLDVTGCQDKYADILDIEYIGMSILYKKCSNCGFIYRNVVLDEVERQRLNEVNRDYDLRGKSKIEWFSDIITLPPERSENYQRCKFLEKYLNITHGRMLDVGAGLGMFLHTFSGFFKNWECLGLDPTPNAGAVLSQHGINILTGFIDDFPKNEVYDLVTMNLVLEHVHDYRNLLLNIKDKLKPGAKLFIEVPSDKDIGHLEVVSGRFMFQHDFIFSQDVLSKILKECEYEIEYIDSYVAIRGQYNLRCLARK